MIRILIVEDDSHKALNVEQAVIEFLGSSECRVERAADRRRALEVLRNERFDLLILDLLIPLKEGTAADRKGGEKLLQEVYEIDGLQLPWHIIGLTAHDDLYRESSDAFLRETWVILRYDERTTDWIEQLQKRLNYLKKFKQTALISPRRTEEVDLAIITALRNPEFTAVLDTFPVKWDEEVLPNDKSTTYMRAVVKNARGKDISILAAHASEMGMPAAAALTTKVIINFCPRFVAMAGIAAGVRKNVKLGDVLIADPIWDYGAGKLVQKGRNVEFLPATEQLRISSELLSKFKSLEGVGITKDIYGSLKCRKPDDLPTLRIGPMASGGMVVAYGDRMREISKVHRKLLGIDMETYGVHVSARYSPAPQPQVFSAKSVCDFGDRTKSDDFQGYAALMSAETIKYIALNVLDWN